MAVETRFLVARLILVNPKEELGYDIKLNRLYVIIFLSFLVFLSYTNSLFNPFMWDDGLLVLNNPGLKGGWQSLLNAFNPGSWGLRTDHEAFKSFFRPLHTLHSMFDYRIWGLNPFGYHLSNTLFHLFNTVLVYFVASRLMKNELTSLLAASIFAVHPVHTESVSFISARVDLICGVFLLTTFYLYSVSHLPQKTDKGKKQTTLYYLSFLLFGLALLGKEMALTLPLLLSIYSYIYEEKGARIKKVLPYFVIVIFYLLFRVFGLSSFVGQHKLRADIITFIYSMLVIVFDYIRLLFAPYPLQAYYTLTWYTALDIKIAFIMLMIVLTGAGLVWLWRQGKVTLVYCILWTFISLVPVLNVGSLGEFSMAERYLYLPSIGFSMFFAIVIFYLSKGIKTFLSISCVLLIVYSGLTIQRNIVWSDELLFFKDMVRGAPGSPLPHANLASAYNERGDFKAAIKELEVASSLAMLNHNLHYNLGNLYGKVGRTGEAIERYTKAITIKNDYAEAYNGLGIVYAKDGNWEMGEKQFQQALKFRPGFKQAISNLNRIYRKRSGN